MKNKIFVLTLVILSVLLVSATAFAEGTEVLTGFYDIDMSDANVSITPYSGNTKASAVTKNVDADAEDEEVFKNSNRFELLYKAAETGRYYGVILVEGTGLPTKDNEILYIDQVTATSENVGFNVYPILPEETTELSLYITNDNPNSDLVAVPLNYCIATVEASPYTPGDINGDGDVSTKDVTFLRRYIATGYDIVVVEEALDINRDGEVTTKDVTILRRFIAGGYGVELK